MFTIPIFPNLVTLIFKVEVFEIISFLIFERFSKLENLSTFKTFHLSYNNGNLIPNGTRINMPSFINSDSLVNYMIILRTRDDVRHYISIDGSAATRQCNFNGIKLKYYVSNNILEVVDNAGILIYLAGTKFLTAI